MTFRGLTWDHPRGRDALRAAAPPGLLEWDVQPLEGFESHPIADLCARYDLVVLDHPHLGEAVEAGCLRPLDDLFAADELAVWAEQSIGQSWQSYSLAGRQWALPLDAATQVLAARADLVGYVPSTWDEVRSVARSEPTALSLAGPHAFVTFASISVALGEEPLVSAETGLAAFDLMVELDARAPAETRVLNPIGLLELMTTTDRLALCPLVYGYVNYSGPVTFGDAPAVVPGGRPGSTLGGTGIAVSARTEPSPELLDHTRWLMAQDTQRWFVPAHAGQPSSRAAWQDEQVNADAHGFYQRTTRTCEQAWVRPRHAGYVAFQTVAAETVRGVLAGDLTPAAGVTQLTDFYRASILEPTR
jgi:multiple sugar transport system substrate-binding protein